MNPPRHAFSVDASGELGAKRLGWIKAFAGAAVVLLTVGAGATLWSSKHALKADVDSVKAQVMAPLDVLDAQVQVLSARAAVVEASVADLKTDLQLIRAQLFEIARATGARQVAPSPEGVP